jgi:3-methyladenine DNA glycosylase AlkD
MLPKKKPASRAKTTKAKPAVEIARAGGKEQVAPILAELKRIGTKERLDEMGPKYGIHTSNAFGVAMSDMQKIAKRIGRDHALAVALWASGNYEARTVAALIDEPEKVTSSQMEQWCADFDNWAICDSVCFFLFDRTPHAFAKVEKWAKNTDEFKRRAAFALLASVALHDKSAATGAFLKCLPFIEKAASDNRNFVKKAVNWALRAIGERNSELHDASVALAARLAESADATAKWVGKDALKQLKNPAVLKRLAARAKACA